MMFYHTPLIAVMLPGVTGLIIYVAHKYFERFVDLLATAVSTISVLLILSLIGPLFDARVYGRSSIRTTYSWIQPLNIDFGFLIDNISLPIGAIIAIVGALSCFYSIKYMKNVENKSEYYANLLLFMTGMMGVIFSINLIQFYLFWELMLIPSYFILAHWGTSASRQNIAFKYFIFTHMGALFLLLGILSLYSFTGSFSLLELRFRLIYVPISSIPIIFTLFTLGFFVKMAAFPLHTWLPDTHSEAPTPISAMLSGAMLNCGAYGIARILLPIFGGSMVSASNILLSLAIITMIYGGLMALAQTDIKRLLAYSSISQMGYILFGFSTVSSLGVMGSLFHIVNHAICKALLFLCIGSIIHQTETRNMKQLGGLIRKMPITGFSCLIGIFSLAGTPPFNGFWSEWMIFGGGLASGKVIFTFIGVVSTIITAGYLLQFGWQILFGPVPKKLENVKESPKWILAPIVVLATASIILGLWPGLALEFLKPAADYLAAFFH
jgi:NADH-quinone oxidoreductase subunit M